MQQYHRSLLTACLAASFAIAGFVSLTSCSKHGTRVEEGDRAQILHMGNGDEVEDIDPQITTGIPEHNIIAAIFEGLVTEDPTDLHPVPGVAERWDVSEDKTVYTFHLRPNAKWSNGDPLTAKDFYQSYQRILNPKLAAEYANMLFIVKNAEAYYKGQVKDFKEVGFRVIDDRTLEVTLVAPTPYFLFMMAHHYSWWPVHIPTVQKFGGMEKRGTGWTRPENFVGNGPFVVSEWRVNEVLKVKRNSNYWDAATVKLNEIHFYPIQSRDTEDRAFRSGQLHVTYEVHRPKMDSYKKDMADMLRMDPYLGNYFYRVNVTHPILKDKRIRKALSMSIDRETIVKNVTKANETAAYYYTHPDAHLPGFPKYEPRARVTYDIEGAKKLLAEAGYPDGKGLPPIEIHFNTDEKHKAIAEAIQQMWKKNLGIEATLVNQEWKVYLDVQDQLAYQVSRAGWIGDYEDPNTFLEMWMTGDGNNDTGWSNAEYDKLIEQARVTVDVNARLELFQKAEAMLLDETVVIPIFFYTKPHLVRPSVKNWLPNILDHHPYKYVYLQAATK
jgi:oligopeptide transport system substrate-binding protein